MKNLNFQWVNSLSFIPEKEWDSLQTSKTSPLLRWSWLYYLEKTCAVGEGSGWLPYYLLVRQGDLLVAGANFYFKTHSVGEFVYDHVWVDAARQLHIPYGPKLVGMSPFTPATGWQFLLLPLWRPSERAEVLERLFSQVAILAKTLGAPLVQLNFVAEDLGNALKNIPAFRPWNHTSFLWTNNSYKTFDDFLQTFDKNQRKNIRKEREAVENLGIRFQWYLPQELEEPWLEDLWDFYKSTNDQFGPWSCRFLPPQWFMSLGTEKNLPIRVLLAWETGETRPLAMALFVEGHGQLLGRYWGARKFVKNLHFCTCYYEPLEWCIRQGLKSFDPGAGSPHKVRRGFDPVASTSWHNHENPILQELFTQYLPQFNDHEESERQGLELEIPRKVENHNKGV